MQYPKSAEALAHASWTDIEPFYEELAMRPLGQANVENWLSDWSWLTKLVSEVNALANFDYARDTADAAKEALQLRFAVEIVPRVEEQEIRLGCRLLDLGYSRAGLETMIRRFGNQRELFWAENVELMAKLEGLSSRYNKLVGAMAVEWQGTVVTVQSMLAHLEQTDRPMRERAFKAMFRPYIERRDDLEGLFDQMYELRQQVAVNAGLDNFRDYAHRQKNRFDYSSDDCLSWHSAVEATVVPLLDRIREQRRQQMGLDSLRPWDLNVDPTGLPPLHPFDDVGHLVAGAKRIFDQLDSDLGAQFRLLADEGWLDIGSRLGKAPGGFHDQLPVRGRSVIFANAVGVPDDVRTLLHESGHAFHAFAASTIEPCFQQHPGMEMAEVASMSMELLGAPLLVGAGFYTEDEFRRFRMADLELMLTRIAHIASIDAYQHWIYTHAEGRDRDARDQSWLEIRSRFDPVTDWTGLESERVARWLYQLHIFSFPFYYIEYGLAQMAALQIWRNSLQDPKKALQDYRSALALGATQPMPELYRTAGAEMFFDAESVGELMQFVEQHWLSG